MPGTPGTSGASASTLSYARRRLADEACYRELAWFNQDEQYPYEEVDFSQNELSSSGMQAVLDVCRCCPKLRVLKLYKNRICDEGAKGLAELCKAVPGIKEMHLSHNRFTVEGVEHLVTAAEQARAHGTSPLWLRLEQNLIDDPYAVIRDLESRLDVCAPQDDRCSARNCCRQKKVHLPFFHLQHSNRQRDSIAHGIARGARNDRDGYNGGDTAWRSWGKGMYDGSGGKDGGGKGGYDGPYEAHDYGRRGRYDGQGEDWDEDGWEDDWWGDDGGEQWDNGKGGKGTASSRDFGRPEGESHDGLDGRSGNPQEVQRQMDAQNKKLDLIFSILKELQERQANLEAELQQLRREQQLSTQLLQPVPVATEMVQGPVQADMQQKYFWVG